MLKNSVKNVHLDLNAKRVFIPAIQMVQSQVSGASVILDAGFSAGAPQLLELGSTDLPAFRMEATTDALDWLWVPHDFDNRHRLLVRYLWTSAYPTANGTARFDTLYTALQTGSTLAAGATALTIAAAASTKVSATALTLYWSKFGQLAPIATAGNAYHTFNPATIAVAFNTKVGAVTGLTIASDFVFILGVELVYTPRLTFGQNSRNGRLLVDGLHPNVELDVTNDI